MKWVLNVRFNNGFYMFEHSQIPIYTFGRFQSVSSSFRLSTTRLSLTKSSGLSRMPVVGLYLLSDKEKKLRRKLSKCLLQLLIELLQQLLDLCSFFCLRGHHWHPGQVWLHGYMSPLSPFGHIWDMMLVWRKGNIKLNCFRVTVLCTIIMVHKVSSSSYRSVDCIWLWSCLV